MNYDVIVHRRRAGRGERRRPHRARRARDRASSSRELVGGECSYWACMPSKALLRPVASARRRTPRRRRAPGGHRHARRRRRARAPRRVRLATGRTTARCVGSTTPHIDLLRGHGRLVGERRVVVGRPHQATSGGQPEAPVELTARHAVVVATGTRAAIPPVPGLADARPWTSREATSAKTAPRRLVDPRRRRGRLRDGDRVAGARQRQVTIAAARTAALPTTEPFAGELLAAAFARPRHRRAPDGRDASGRAPCRRHRRGHARRRRQHRADELLVATGRAPQHPTTSGSRPSGCDRAPGSTSTTTCRVPAVAGGWLYAAGDVNHRALLTHMGKYQARVCGDVIAARAAGAPDARRPPGRAHAATADDAPCRRCLHRPRGRRRRAAARRGRRARPPRPRRRLRRRRRRRAPRLLRRRLPRAAPAWSSTRTGA